MTLRALSCTALLLAAVAIGPAAAQQRRAPAKPTATPAEPAPPALFPCRTAAETCYLGVVVGTQVAVLYTNAPNAQGIDAKPLDVTAGENARVDLKPNEGRVVMLTGVYDPKAGLTKAELIEVASPLASLAIKAQLAGGGEEPAGGGRAAPARRR